MSGKRFKLNSNFQLKKCTSGVDDRISKLPDDILLHILSFLTVKEVVVTSLVSPRWSHLWRYTPNLIFQNGYGRINIPITMPECSHYRYWKTPKCSHSCPWEFLECSHPYHWDNPTCNHRCDWEILCLKNVEWVNSVLNSHKAVSLNKFSLCLHLHTFQPLSKWLHFVLSRRVKSLELELSDSISCVLDSNIILNSGIQSSFLKELTLAKFDVSGEAVELFLRICPLLERLFIDGATLTSDLVVDGPALKHLKLQCLYVRCEVSVKVSALNLTRFDCKYRLEHVFLENVPNLVEASIRLEGPLEKLHHFAKEAAKFEILTIILCSPPTAFSVPQMPKLNKLVLNCSVANRADLPALPVTCVLQASPCLREFRLKIGHFWMFDYMNDDEDYYERFFEIPEFGFSHNCLQVFEFSNFCGRAADHMKLLRYIVVNCVALREITITTQTPENLPEFKDYLEYDFHVDRSEMEVVTLKMRKRAYLTIF